MKLKTGVIENDVLQTNRKRQTLLLNNKDSELNAEAKAKANKGKRNSWIVK